MSARDELAGVIYKARWVDGIKDIAMTADAAIADAILAAGYSKPRTISTVEELDAVPDGSVVMTWHGLASNVYRDHPMITDADHHYLVESGPATVLYTPKES